MSDWSDKETDDPHYADRCNFYKVERWSRDGLRVRAHALGRQQSRQGASHLRADDQASAAHSADHPPADAGAGRVAAA